MGAQDNRPQIKDLKSFVISNRLGSEIGPFTTLTVCNLVWKNEAKREFSFVFSGEGVFLDI